MSRILFSEKKKLLPEADLKLEVVSCFSDLSIV